ncbi:MAG TPA: phosphoserine phosphatase [Polyangiaceae bacterium]|nr:phosphoserine phosphatase [Polyangiaceae bacterium]
MKMQVAHASLPKLGEYANGDRPFHRQDAADRHLLAVIDGLGHGPEAEHATLAGLKYLNEVPLDTPFEQIMLGVHESMRGTRGAAGTVCIVAGTDIVACAVGNVELRSVQIDVPLISSAGILGVRVQKFRVCRTKIQMACRLVLFSDGLTNPTGISELQSMPAQLACDRLLSRHRRTYDDATVLIADLE